MMLRTILSAVPRQGARSRRALFATSAPADPMDPSLLFSEANSDEGIDEFVGGWYDAWKKADDDAEAELTKRKEEKQVVFRERKVDEAGRAHGIGRRKTAVAMVWIKEVTEGTGKFYVNKKPMADYFQSKDFFKDHAIQPFVATGTLGRFDVVCHAAGGGLGGQSGAVRLGLSRALQNFNPEFRPVLKSQRLLTRDGRMVERKKPGQKKARKKFQWVKR